MAQPNEPLPGPVELTWRPDFDSPESGVVLWLCAAAGLGVTALASLRGRDDLAMVPLGAATISYLSAHVSFALHVERAITADVGEQEPPESFDN